jgi:phytoene dehydrogenase-like protein
LNGTKRSVELDVGGKKESVEARFLLVNFGRNVLAKFTGKPFQPDATDEGSVFKINMLLRKLPKLKAKKYTAAQAWCGTFHSDEGYEQMNASYTCASQGRLPEKTPCEVYCHTLTDDSILGPDLREQGYHTMTLFGLDAPWSVFSRDNVRMRKEAEQKFLASMNQWLEEPMKIVSPSPATVPLYRKQKPSRYRRLVRNVSRQYFSRCPDVAIRYHKKGSRPLGG